MSIRLFDPEGIKSTEYKNTYAELGRIPEFEAMLGKELMFVWYFANRTSPIIKTLDDKKRVAEALKRSGFNPEPMQYESILKLVFSEKMERAIVKMGSFIPGARYLGWQSLKAIFDEYNDIALSGTSKFSKTTGEGETKVTEVDYAAYARVSKDITLALPKLIQQMEEGFGITITGSEESDDEGEPYFRDWNLLRRER